MAINFSREDNPKYGKAQQLTRLITRILANNPSHFTYTGTGTYIIGDTDLVVIDPGPMDLDHGAALINAIAGRPVRAIVVTHNHLDHSPLSNWLRQQTDAPILGYGYDELTKPTTGKGPQLDAGWDTSFHPNSLLRDGDSLSGTGWSLKAIHTPGHTSNHLCFYLSEEKALFSGDHLMGWSTSVIIPPDGNLRDYLKSLHRLLEVDITTIYPTHGLPITRPHRYIRATLVHRNMREQQILKQLKNGPATVDDLVNHMYKGLDPRLIGAAALSVAAHNIALTEEGVITQTGSDPLTAIYSLSP